MDYDSLWQILEKYQFEIDSNILSHVTCIICNKILIDAYLGPCGCNYCKKCITKHLRDGQKYCPGNISDCLIEELIFQTNVVKDNGVNRRVSKLDVKCPSRSCEYHCELMQMTEHLRVCNNREIQCPFHYMGCVTETSQHQQMSDHLMTEVYNHNKILIGWMLNMRNEVTSLLADTRISINNSANSELPINSLSLADHNNDESINKELLESLQRDMRDLLTERNETRRLVKEIKDNSDQQIARLKERIDYQSNEIAQLKITRHAMEQLSTPEPQPQPDVSTSFNPNLFLPFSADPTRRILRGPRKLRGSIQRTSTMLE